MASPAAAPAGGLVPTHELFNRKLKDFLDDLAPLLGHMAEYGLLTKYVRLLSGMDPRANMRIFVQHVVEPLGARILARDEAFFLQNCDEVYATVVNWSQCASQGIVPMLKQVWHDLAEQDKDAIWSHLHVLVALARRQA